PHEMLELQVAKRRLHRLEFRQKHRDALGIVALDADIAFDFGKVLEFFQPWTIRKVVLGNLFVGPRNAWRWKRNGGTCGDDRKALLARQKLDIDVPSENFQIPFS